MEPENRSGDPALSARDCGFWATKSGVSSAPGNADRAAAAHTAARAAMDSSAITAGEVAGLLHVDPSTVRRRVTDRQLYAYLSGGGLLFPAWQFCSTRDEVIPSLGAVLAVLPANLHPQSVAGFFLTPQPDLILHDSPVSAKAWLEASKPVSDVLALARGLAAGL